MFVPGLAAAWAAPIYHSYRVFREIRKYLLKLERILGMHWNEQNPPHPLALVGYVIILIGTDVMSVYFLNVLPQPPDIMGMCALRGRVCLTWLSTLSAGWVIWLIGVLFSGVMIGFLLDLWRRFGK